MILGLLWFTVAWGLWTMKGFARKIVIAWNAVQLVWNFPLSLVTSWIVFQYLMRKEIAELFGDSNKEKAMLRVAPSSRLEVTFYFLISLLQVLIPIGMLWILAVMRVR